MSEDIKYRDAFLDHIYDLTRRLTQCENNIEVLKRREDLALLEREYQHRDLLDLLIRSANSFYRDAGLFHSCPFRIKEKIIREFK